MKCEDEEPQQQRSNNTNGHDDNKNNDDYDFIVITSVIVAIHIFFFCPFSSLLKTCICGTAMLRIAFTFLPLSKLLTVLICSALLPKIKVSELHRVWFGGQFHSSAAFQLAKNPFESQSSQKYLPNSMGLRRKLKIVKRSNETCHKLNFYKN